MSLIRAIQQLEAIQAQLTQNLKQVEFGLLNQRYQDLCVKIREELQLYQASPAEAGPAAAAQDLESDLPLCSSSNLGHKLFLFQDRVKEFASKTESKACLSSVSDAAAAADAEVLPESKTPPSSPLKEKLKLKAPSTPATPSALLKKLALNEVAVDASAKVLWDSAGYVERNIKKLQTDISSKIAELSSLLEAERRKFQTKIQGFFPDDASQESAELAGDLFDIFYSEGEGALLQKVRHLIVQDCEKEGQDFALSKDGKEDFSFDLWPENNFRDVYSGGKKPKKNAVYFWLDARHNEIGYVFSKSALGGGMITGELYNQIILSHKENDEAIIRAEKARALKQNRDYKPKPKPEREFCLNKMGLNTLKKNILSFILPREPNSELSRHETVMPISLQNARFAILEKHPEIFDSLGGGLSNKHGFYFEESEEAKGLANLFFEEFNILEGNAKILKDFELEKQKDIILRQVNKILKLQSEPGPIEGQLYLNRETQAIIEEAFSAGGEMNPRIKSLILEKVHHVCGGGHSVIGVEKNLIKAYGKLKVRLEKPSPTCFSFFLLQKQNAAKQIKKICLVTVSGELRKLQGSTKLNQEMHKALKIAIEHTVEVLNQEGNPYQYQFKYHAEEKFGVDLALDQLNKVISGESKPLDAKSLNLKDPCRGCSEKKMIAYLVDQLKSDKVQLLTMLGSANLFRYPGDKQACFTDCCKNCQINKIPLLILLKHLQDKKSKSMLKQASDRVTHETAVADAAFAAARPTMPLSLLSRRLSADADAATVDEAKSGKQQKGRKLCFS